MPKVVLPTYNECTHYGVHGYWIAQGQHIAVCQLPKPRLINAIKMLERTITDAYPVQGGKPLSLSELARTEDSLRMLTAELRRRNELSNR